LALTSDFDETRRRASLKKKLAIPSRTKDNCKHFFLIPSLNTEEEIGICQRFTTNNYKKFGRFGTIHYQRTD
jgi:hypothetical protein